MRILSVMRPLNGTDSFIGEESLIDAHLIDAHLSRGRSISIRRHAPLSPDVAPRFPHMSEINSLFSFAFSELFS